MLLELDHVSKDFIMPDGVTNLSVLRDISLNVMRGESIAVTGPSGSGKSTLLNVMGGLDHPSSGKVKLAGKFLSEMPENELAKVRNRDIGFVFQLHHLLPQCTVLENVLIPTIPMKNVINAGETINRARVLLERVGLGFHLHHKPAQLSGGECQRAAVARALINNPGLLLADEPTGSLDRDSSTNLADLLVELNREKSITLILVTHSMELAKKAKRLYILRDGKLTLLEPK